MIRRWLKREVLIAGKHRVLAGALLSFLWVIFFFTLVFAFWLSSQ